MKIYKFIALMLTFTLVAQPGWARDALRPIATGEKDLSWEVIRKRSKELVEKLRIPGEAEKPRQELIRIGERAVPYIVMAYDIEEPRWFKRQLIITMSRIPHSEFKNMLYPDCLELLCQIAYDELENPYIRMMAIAALEKVYLETASIDNMQGYLKSALGPRYSSVVITSADSRYEESISGIASPKQDGSSFLDLNSSAIAQEYFAAAFPSLNMILDMLGTSLLSADEKVSARSLAAIERIFLGKEVSFDYPTLKRDFEDSLRMYVEEEERIALFPRHVRINLCHLLLCMLESGYMSSRGEQGSVIRTLGSIFLTLDTNACRDLAANISRRLSSGIWDDISNVDKTLLKCALIDVFYEMARVKKDPVVTREVLLNLELGLQLMWPDDIAIAYARQTCEKILKLNRQRNPIYENI